MAPVAIRQIDDAIFDNSRSRKRVQHPLREERRTEVDGRNARPVEMCAALTALEVLVVLGHGVSSLLGPARQRRSTRRRRCVGRFSQGMCRTNELASAVDAEASSMCE
jgi:hypothetical protein